MKQEIYKSTLAKRSEAAAAIVKAEMGSFMKKAPAARVFLDKRDGSIVTIFGEINNATLKSSSSIEGRLSKEEEGILLWNVAGRREISEIYAMEMILETTKESKNPISWIEHYLTLFFAGVIEWE